MKPMTVGKYDLGGDIVVVRLCDGGGGDYEVPFNGTPTVISIGGDQECFGRLAGVLLHEAKEFCDMRIGCLYIHTGYVAKENGSYTIMETHLQHSEACARVGWFMADCLPDLKRKWAEWKRARHKKR